MCRSCAASARAWACTRWGLLCRLCSTISCCRLHARHSVGDTILPQT